MPVSPAFESQTRRSRQMLNDMVFSAENQTLRVDLPQVGYAARLHIKAFGTITTNASAAGTWKTASGYWPYNLLSRLRLVSNEGLELYNTRGYVNQLVQMVHRELCAPAQNPVALNYGVSNAGAPTAVTVFPTGTIGVSTTYNVCVDYYIPIASDRFLTAGLLLLQNQATRVSLECTLGAGADWGLTAGAETPSITVRAALEYFSVPADPQAQPDTSYIHRWIEDVQPWTASGDNLYKVPVNGVILNILSIYENAGSPQPFFSTAGNPNTPNFGNVYVQYAASMRPEQEDFRLHLAQQRLVYGLDFPDGVFVWDFASGGGIPSLGIRPRDVYDTSQLTEFAIAENTTVTPGANSKIYRVRRELQPRSA